MDIKMKRKEDGSFSVAGLLNFSRGGYAIVSVECEKSYDQLLLKSDAISHLNEIASKQGMSVSKTEGAQAVIPVKVERGESARVRYVEFPVEILPNP